MMMTTVGEREVDDGAGTGSRTGAHDFARVFREDGPGLWRTIYAFTGGRRDITEDVVAEAFARAIAYGGTIREPLPWLYRTSFRLAQTELKRERRSERSARAGGSRSSSGAGRTD